MRRIAVQRYVTPLREGGSLPGIVEADDDGLYVLKFRGAGQGTNALVADWLGARLAQALELAAPRVALARLDGELARTEPDPEIQHLIRASHGINLAVDYLPGAPVLAVLPGSRRGEIERLGEVFMYSGLKRVE